MKQDSESIDDVVIKVIQAMAVNPKSLDVLMDVFAKQTSIFGRDVLDNESKNQLKSLFVSDVFLRQFVGQFKALFTNEEIYELLEIYQSSVMKKWFKYGQILSEPLYHAMNKQVEEMRSGVLCEHAVS